MRIHCSKKFEAGLTLVDVVMAVLVLGVMAAGIMGSFRYGLFIMQVVRENQRASQIMLEKLETIRLYSWTQVNSNGFIPRTFTDVYDPQSTNHAVQGCTYYGAIAGPSTMPFTSSYTTNMRQLTVTLQWTNRSLPHRRTITTYIAKDGIQNYVF